MGRFLAYKHIFVTYVSGVYAISSEKLFFVSYPALSHTKSITIDKYT